MTPAERTRRPAPACSGHTLLEVVFGVAVTAILMGAMVSVMTLAARAVGGADGPAEMTSRGRDVIEQVTADLSLARSFTERTASAVEFTVPDRDGDGIDEVIRYEWSGQAGGPLTRKYNAGPAVVIAEDVHHFALSYLTKTVRPSDGGSDELQESEERLLASHDDAEGGSMNDHAVKGTKWCGQYFLPALPSNAVHWKVTRVRMRLSRAGTTSDGQFAVQVRPADAGGKPTAEVLDEAVLDEAALSPSYEWIDVNLGAPTGIEAGQGACIVVKYVSGSDDAVEVEYESNNNPMTLETHWLITSNSGGTWTTYPNNRDMRFSVYGTITTEGGPQW